MLIGIRAMHRFATFLKIAALASVTVVAATTVTAQDVTVIHGEFTVNVYETGYFPNVVYTAEASSIRFVNKTTETIGIDTEPFGEILIRFLNENSSVVRTIDDIAGRTVRVPFIYGSGRGAGGTFQIVEGSAPDS
jgi:hypothetical protein